jgi:protein ImuB
MSRFVAVALVNLRIELARTRVEASFDSAILGVVIARPDGAVKDETSLLGNTRLDEVSHEAFALGIRPGQTLAAASARSAELTVRVVPLLGVSSVLEGLAEMTLAFGPTTAFEAGGFAGDVVWVDVTGCGHLHHRGLGVSPSEDGESVLLSRLAAKVESMGYACQVAIADGPRVAAAVARFGQRRESIVPKGGNAEALARLPLSALGLEEKTRAWLSALGLARVRDLQKLPRASLGSRLGAGGARVMALLEGDDRSALTAYVPPETPSETVELEHGIESADALLFVAKRLARGLEARLEGRCQKAARLELLLKLDRIVEQEDQKIRRGLGSNPNLLIFRSSCSILSIVLAAPLARADELFAVLKTKIEAQDREAPVTAPIVAVTLRATEVVTAHAVALDLLTPEAKADRALPRLASELSAELGHEAVGTLALSDTWVLEERSRLVPFGVKRRETRGLPALLSGGVEPTRLLTKPIVIKRSSLLHARLVARFESVEWWRRERRVEHYVSWIDPPRGDTPRTPGPMAWVEIDPKSESARVMGWLD